jgi:hypothetical protein
MEKEKKHLNRIYKTSASGNKEKVLFSLTEGHFNEVAPA